MFDFSQVQIENIVVHKVGNKGREEGVKVSRNALVIEQDFIKSALLKYFLTPFKDAVFYNFFHEEDLELNQLHAFASGVFSEENSFYNHSVNIAQHLYESSVHPQIKEGEFYMVCFKDCVVEGELCDAIGIFKSENKETYLKVFQRNNNFDLNCEEGVNINKLDKGCLIFNTEKDLGYKVCIVDHTNKSNEAQYWKNDFLKLKYREDSFYQTNHAISLCKSFCDKVVTEKNSFSKKEQVELKAKAAEYFAKKETFNKDEFMGEVIKAPQLIEAFEDFNESYVVSNNLPPIREEFALAPDAAKSAKRDFKSILKLDKNFHIYIHGSPDLIENGYDDARLMNYYKVYYREEK